MSRIFQEDEADEDYTAEDGEAAERRSTEKNFSNEECDGDGLEELPSSAICRRSGAGRWRGPITRKVSQTSVYLQEWDIPYEQLQLGELIGKVKTEMSYSFDSIYLLEYVARVEGTETIFKPLQMF